MPIRPATIHDAAALAALGRQTFHDTFAAHNKPEHMDAYLSTAFQPATIAAELAEPGSVYLVAEEPGQTAGVAGDDRSEPPELARDPGAHFVRPRPPNELEPASQLIGFARLVPAAVPACITTPAPLRLAKLYVATNTIGTGVGAALMRACCAWAADAGYRSLWLGVWEHNERAKAFYARWGFQPVGEEIFRLGDDDQTDQLMQLEFRRS